MFLSGISKYNSPELSQPKSRKFKWSVWFPYPSSWLNALVLSIMLSVILCVVRITGITGRGIAVFLDSPEIFVIFEIIALFSPIATIAFTHHLLHLLLSKLSSKFQSPEIGEPQGFIPGLISWWVGLYSWLVIAISLLLSGLIITIVLLIFDLRYVNLIHNYNDYKQAEAHIQSTFGVLYIIISALMYQIEYLFKQRLISTKTASAKSHQIQLNTNNSAQDEEINKIRTESGLD